MNNNESGLLGLTYQIPTLQCNDTLYDLGKHVAKGIGPLALSTFYMLIVPSPKAHSLTHSHTHAHTHTHTHTVMTMSAFERLGNEKILELVDDVKILGKK